MTQLPQPPQMPPPEPLDESERALAQVLRSLPAGAPPAELDARILGAARRAVHLAPPRKRDRRWLVGLGTAASALLAIGVILKTHGPGQESVFAPRPEARLETPAAAAAPASVPEATTAAAPPPPPIQVQLAAPRAAADAITPSGDVTPVAAAAQVRMKDQSAAEPASPPAKSEAPEARKVPSAFPVGEARRNAVAAPPPAMTMPAAPSSVIMQEPAPMAAAPPPPPPPPALEQAQAKELQFSAAPRDASTQNAAPMAGALGGYTTNGAKQSAATSSASTSGAATSSVATSSAATSGAAPASPAPTSTPQPDKLMSSGGSSEAFSPPGEARSLDRVEVTGDQIRQATSEDEELDARGVLPPIDEDTKLSPAQWIKRIRARVKAADGQGARESLRRYRVRYPEAAIPDDLQPLQQ